MSGMVVPLGGGIEGWGTKEEVTREGVWRSGMAKGCTEGVVGSGVPGCVAR
jgi:hypothetical protein